MGGNRVEGERNKILQTKLLLEPLERGGERCFNCIDVASFMNDRERAAPLLNGIRILF